MPGAELVDVTDKTLGQRLEPPSKPKLPDRSLDLNSGLPLQNGLRGTVLLAFLVDVDGSLRETTVIQSSGNPLIDEAALNWWRYAKYKSPAKLDGRAVRALTYWKMPINTTGRDLYRPGHLPGGR